jgi:methyltransferase (TIGR00027 family)
MQVDPLPHVLEDDIGLKLAAPNEGWRQRGDMHPEGTKRFRAAIVARGRFIEDLVLDHAIRGLNQFVILGAGLDTFAQRRAEVASRMRVFEIDRPGTSVWKRQRLIELGFGVPDWLKLVPVDFEANESWLDKLMTSGFDKKETAVFSSMGVSMYLTEESIFSMLRQVASLAEGTKIIMTFLQPLDRVEPEERNGYEMAMKGANASGTPFLSFFSPPEILSLARKAGFHDAQHISAAFLNEKYFSGRTDDLRTSSGEELIVATA